MAVETVKKRTANVQIENGYDAEGNMRYSSVSLGTLSKDRWDADKILAISSALAPVLSQTVDRTEGTSTFVITAS